MTSEAPRRTLTGLAPRTGAPGNARLIRSNRLAAAPAAAEPEESRALSPQHGASRAVEPAPSQTAGLTESESGPGAPSLPKYQRLRRREARVHDDQANALTELSRRLNKERRRPDGTTSGERITDNTLLRIAIDLLLSRADELTGTTEQELAASLGLEPRRQDPA
ncbi:hypothetical protein [Georgenia daeguensis]|uniref:Uncharacterized protein n=1 Tax=Georgenia daeguensis TaxID=908355 RepID=A0ABP8EYY7_9MICO